MLIPCWICYFQNNNCFSNIFEIESIVTSIGITQFQSIRVTEYILIKQGLKLVMFIVTEKTIEM